MSINSRAKGARFERQIAKDLRSWLGEEFTVSRLRTDEQRGQSGDAGEFRITGPWAFPLCIECKTAKSWKEAHLWQMPIPGPLAVTKGKNSGWWLQACSQAITVSKRPLLIVTRPLGPTLAILRPQLRHLMGLSVALPRMRFELDSEMLEAVLWSQVVQTMPGNLRGAA